MSKNNKKAKRTCSAIMLGALAITLSSCSGATNTMVPDYAGKTYVSSGDYTITNGELWDELKWSASSVLESKIQEVVIMDEIKSIDYVLNNSYDDIKDDEEKLKVIWSVNDLGDDNQAGDDVDKEWESKDDLTEEIFNEIKKKYTERMIDYVVQDIFNLTFKIDNYFENVALLTDTLRNTAIQKYVDGIYSSYQKSETATGVTFKEIIDTATQRIIDASKDEKLDDIDYTGEASNAYDVSGLLDIAQSLTELYYPTYAKELYAYEGTRTDADTKLAEDTDDDDDEFGYFAHSTFISKYKTKYINTYDVNFLQVGFASETEFDNTLRAFGIRIYNKKYYFIKDNADNGYGSYLDSSSRMTYDEYVKYYDDFANSDLTTENGVIAITDEAILPIYVALYNYVYGGYRDSIKVSGVYDFETPNDLQDLRKLTYNIIDAYTTVNVKQKYQALVQALTEMDEFCHTADYVNDTYSNATKAYVYDTLKLTEDGSHENQNDPDAKKPVESLQKRYSTSAQSTTAGYSIFYKFNDQFQELNNPNSDKYDKEAYTESLYYNSDLSNNEIFEHIKSNKELYTTIYDLLIADQVSSDDLTNYVSNKTSDVKVKIYVEAVEISYAKSHSDYSSTHIANKDKNILATLSYNGTTYNLPIVSELSKDDSSALRWAGTDKVYGVFDDLELANGPTTAITLLTRKIIKDTDVYKEVKNNSEYYSTYNDYINNVLTNFANGGLASSGYDSSIGKYNFLMLYFHDSDIDSIINNNFYVNLASAKLLTDYSNQTLASLFKKYAEIAYSNYFSLVATRMYVYFDQDGDGEADEIDYTYDSETGEITIDADSWVYETKEFDLNDNGVIDAGEEAVTYEVICKSLIYKVYELIASDPTSHTDTLSSLVTEIQNASKASYSQSITSADNTWAKYKKLGLNVKTEDVTVTNATIQIDFNLKQRLFDYARGYSGTEDAKTKTYQYYLEDSSSYPTCYIEGLTSDSVNSSNVNNDIIFTNDGYNLILVTSGTKASSAKFSIDDYEDDMLTNITLYYNEQYVTIDNIYNETDELNVNQIMLYLIDYAINQSSTLAPSSLATAFSSFLEPIYTKYTGTDTQRIVNLSFIKAATNSTESLYDVVKFETHDNFNGTDGVLSKLITIYQNTADDYSFIVKDTTGTSDIYPDWWETIESLVSEFIQVGGNDNED